MLASLLQASLPDFGNIASLVGQGADGALRKRIQTQLGGESGCAQLYDLTADLLKLLTF